MEPVKVLDKEIEKKMLTHHYVLQYHKHSCFYYNFAKSHEGTDMRETLAEFIICSLEV